MRWSRCAACKSASHVRPTRARRGPGGAVIRQPARASDDTTLAEVQGADRRLLTDPADSGGEARRSRRVAVPAQNTPTGGSSSPVLDRRPRPTRRYRLTARRSGGARARMRAEAERLSRKRRAARAARARREGSPARGTSCSSAAADARIASTSGIAAARRRRYETARPGFSSASAGAASTAVVEAADRAQSGTSKLSPRSGAPDRGLQV